MAGFDMQFTAAGSAERFAAELGRFFGADDPAVVQANAAFARLNLYGAARAAQAGLVARQGMTGAVRDAAMAEWERTQGAGLRPAPADLATLEQATAGLRARLRAQRRSLLPAHGGRGISFMDRALANLTGYGASLLDRNRADAANGGAATVASENRRDRLMAANVRWLRNEGYPGRKMILWAHNAHVMNAAYGPDWRSVSLAPRPDWMRPMGAELAADLGRDLYTIGITAHAGEDGFAAAMPSTAVAPASPGSIEGAWHGLGQPYAFVDLRRPRNRRDGAIVQPQAMRLPKYEEVLIADPTRPYDGLLFIDRMARATRLEG